MQRRRKRNRAAAANRKQPAGIKLDKSLPSLPPDESEALASRPVEDPAADAYADATTEVASQGAAPALDTGRSDINPSTPRQPPNQGNNNNNNNNNLILPSSTYRSNRNSTITRDQPDADTGGGEFLIPLAFDPSGESHHHPSSRAPPPPPPHGSSESSPHIAYQEKGRDRSVLEPVRYRQEEPVAGAANNRSSLQRSHHQPHASDGFKAHEWSATTKPVARSGSVRSSRSDLVGHTREASSFSTPSPESARSSTQPTRDTSTVDSQRSTALDTSTTTTPSIPSRPSHELRKLHENNSVDSAKSLPATNNIQYPPKRGDSLESRLHQPPRKDFGTSARPPSMSMSQIGEVPGRLTPPLQDGTPSSSSHRPSASRGTTPKLGESPRTQRSDSHPEPPRHGRQTSAVQSDTGRPADHSASPSLLRYSVGGGGDFSMDEDMQRIMGLDDTQMAQHESFLRRMSNSVRHGRSFSDKGTRLSRDAKRPRTPVNGFTPPQDPPTPSAGSPEIRSDEVAFLRSELRKERQRTLEREQKIAELEGALNATADVKLANTELSEKRSTMVVLDAKKEIVMRELSVLTDYLEAEKRGNGGQLDLGKITNHVLREFVESIQKLKDSFTPQIEELVQKRSDTSEEIANLNRLKEKNFQEFEQLSSKNAQLAELNNQLVHQIQELYKANSVEGNRNANGLGIYSHGKDKSMSDAMKAAAEITQPVPTTNISEDAEPATIVPGPQVVSIRKGQPRKFNWKKGGQNVAKGVTKGLKGAFMSSESAGQEMGPGIPRSQTHDPTRQGFGFFGNQKKQVGGKPGNAADTAPALSDSPGMSSPPFPLTHTHTHTHMIYRVWLANIV